MERFDDTGDDPIEGISDAAVSARDALDARGDGGAPDIVGEGDAERRSVDGAYGDVLDDPAMQPVIEGGGGVSGGFEQAESDLVGNATDSHGSTRRITEDAIDEEGPQVDDDVYGEADDIREADR